MPIVKWRSKQGILDDMAAAYLTLTGRDVNDLNRGSVLRTLFDVLAEEHEETEYNIATALLRASVRYAQSGDLDHIAADEGVTRHTAAGASGYCQLSRSSAAPSDSSVASAGSIVLTNGQVEFTNTEPCRLLAGQTAWVVDDGVWADSDIPFSATTVGPGSNSGAGTITTVISAPAGVDTATNSDAFDGGRLPENDRDLRARIMYERDRRAGGSRVALLSQMLRQSQIYSAAVYEWMVMPSGSRYVKPSPGEIWAYMYPAFTATQTFSVGRESDDYADAYTLNPQNDIQRMRNNLESVRPFPATLKVYLAYTVLVKPVIEIVLPKSYRIGDTNKARMEIAQRIRNYLLQLKIAESFSAGHALAIVGQVVPFKSATVQFEVTRSRTHMFTETLDVDEMVRAEDDEILKPYGSYLEFGEITLETEE